MRAVILDLDGLVVDTEEVNHRALNTYLARHHVQHHIDAGEYGEFLAGLAVEENATYLIRNFHVPGTVADFLAEREAIYRELIADPRNLVPMPGLAHLLDGLDARGLVMSIASASPRSEVETVLRGMEIRSRFRTVLTATDVAKPKPEPDVYLQSMVALGLTPVDCVAVEDSAAGIAAAKAAGLRVVNVPNAYARWQDLSLADAKVGDLTQVLTWIDRLGA